MTNTGSDNVDVDPNTTHKARNGLTGALGAPVEMQSPLGQHVGLMSAVSLNLSRLLGMGIYSTPGVILNSLGSVGMSLIFWLLGSLLAFGTHFPLPCYFTSTLNPAGGLLLAGLNLYNELASMFPRRSGGDVVFLVSRKKISSLQQTLLVKGVNDNLRFKEQAYPRPRFLVPTTFAISSVLLSFSARNATGEHSTFIDRGCALTQDKSLRAIHPVCTGAYCYAF